MLLVLTQKQIREVAVNIRGYAERWYKNDNRTLFSRDPLVQLESWRSFCSSMEGDKFFAQLGMDILLSSFVMTAKGPAIETTNENIVLNK